MDYTLHSHDFFDSPTTQETSPQDIQTNKKEKNVDPQSGNLFFSRRPREKFTFNRLRALVPRRDIDQQLDLVPQKEGDMTWGRRYFTKEIEEPPSNNQARFPHWEDFVNWKLAEERRKDNKKREEEEKLKLLSCDERDPRRRHDNDSSDEASSCDSRSSWYDLSSTSESERDTIRTRVSSCQSRRKSTSSRLFSPYSVKSSRLRNSSRQSLRRTPQLSAGQSNHRIPRLSARSSARQTHLQNSRHSKIPSDHQIPHHSDTHSADHESYLHSSSAQHSPNKSVTKAVDPPTDQSMLKKYQRERRASGASSPTPPQPPPPPPQLSPRALRRVFRSPSPRAAAAGGKAKHQAGVDIFSQRLQRFRDEVRRQRGQRVWTWEALVEDPAPLPLPLAAPLPPTPHSEERRRLRHAADYSPSRVRWIKERIRREMRADAKECASILRRLEWQRARQRQASLDSKRRPVFVDPTQSRPVDPVRAPRRNSPRTNPVRLAAAAAAPTVKFSTVSEIFPDRDANQVPGTTENTTVTSPVPLKVSQGKCLRKFVYLKNDSLVDMVRQLRGEAEKSCSFEMEAVTSSEDESSDGREWNYSDTLESEIDMMNLRRERRRRIKKKPCVPKATLLRSQIRAAKIARENEAKEMEEREKQMEKQAKKLKTPTKYTFLANIMKPRWNTGTLAEAQGGKAQEEKEKGLADEAAATALAPATDPLPEQAMNPAAELGVNPVADPAVGLTADSSEVPAAETTTETAADSTADPAADPVEDPTADPAAAESRARTRKGAYPLPFAMERRARERARAAEERRAAEAQMLKSRVTQLVVPRTRHLATRPPPPAQSQPTALQQPGKAAVAGVGGDGGGDALPPVRLPPIVPRGRARGLGDLGRVRSIFDQQLLPGAAPLPVTLRRPADQQKRRLRNSGVMDEAAQEMAASMAAAEAVLEASHDFFQPQRAPGHLAPLILRGLRGTHSSPNVPLHPPPLRR